MAESLAPLKASLSLNISQFTKALKEAQKHVQNTFGAPAQGNVSKFEGSINKASGSARNFASHLKSAERIIGGIVVSQAFYGIALEIRSATKELFTFMGNMEKAKISMKYHLGDEELGKAFIYNMQDFAATTSYNTEQAIQLSQRLMQAQFKPEQVRSVMTVLNDAAVMSGGTAEQLGRILLAITQIKTNNIIKGQELRQLAEANIPIYQILQDRLNLSGEEVMNIGDLKIPGDLGVQVILDALRDRYGGAAEEIAQTVPGMIETIKDDLLILGEGLFKMPYDTVGKGVKSIRDRLEELRDYMAKGGIGAAFEQMFTEKTRNNIRRILAGIRELGKGFLTLREALGPSVKFLFSSLTEAMSIIIPTLAIVVKSIAGLTSAVLKAAPWIGHLAVVIGSLIIAQVAARAMILLWRVTGMGFIATAVANAVRGLAAAIQFLYAVISRGHPIVLIITLIAGALLYLALSSKTVSGWLDTVMKQLASLGGFGFDSILQPDAGSGVTDNVDQFNEMYDLIGDMGSGFDDMGDAAVGAGKKIKDSFLASFDEVFAIPEKNEGGGGGKGDGGNPFKYEGNPFDLGDAGGAIIPEFPREIELPELKWPPFKLPEMPPWVVRLFEGRPFQWPKLQFPKIEFPKFPPPPGAVVTAWQVSMDFIREKLRLVVDALSWLEEKVKNLIPQGVLAPVLERVRQWGADIGKTFEITWETIKSHVAQWVTSVALGFVEIINGFEEFKEGVITKVTEMWETVTRLWPHFWEGIKLVTSHALEMIKDFWEEHKWTILGVVGAIIVGIVLLFTGLPGAIIAIIARLLSMLIPHIGRLVPLFGVQIQRIPALFTNLLRDIPGGIGNLINRIVDVFRLLPDRIKAAIASIPSKVGEVFGKIKLPSFSTLASGVSTAFKSIGPITGFAEGGIIDKDSIVRVGEQGKREAIIPMENSSAMAPFADAVAQRLQSLMGNNNNNQQQDDRPIIHVGTLIADERSLRELERRMQVVRKEEGLRGADR